MRGSSLPLEDPSKSAPDAAVTLLCHLFFSSAMCPATEFSSLDLECGTFTTTRDKDVAFDMGFGVWLEGLWPVLEQCPWSLPTEEVVGVSICLHGQAYKGRGTGL